MILISCGVFIFSGNSFSEIGNNKHSQTQRPGTPYSGITKNTTKEKSKNETVKDRVHELMIRGVVEVVEEEEESRPSISESERINHEVFDNILRRYVSKSGFFDYKEIRRYPQDIAALEAYVEDLKFMDPLTIQDRDEAIAAWLNLYNAMVLLDIIKHYPIQNVLKITDWYAGARYKIGEKKYSLMTLENEIFKDRLRDPRLVFARSFGAKGAPRLNPYAFSGKNIEQELDKASLKVLKDPSFALLDAKKGKLFLSGLFQYYEKEIGHALSFVRRYQQDLPAETQIEYGAFNWTLNEAD